LQRRRLLLLQQPAVEAKAASSYDEWAEYGHKEWFVDKPQVMAVDTETTGLEFHDRPFCVTTSWRKPSGEVASHYFELGEYAEHVLFPMLRDTPYLVMHNAKFDLQKLILVGLIDRVSVQSSRIHDTECIVHLLDEQRRKGLKELARTMLGEETDEEAVLAQARRDAKVKKADGFHVLPREVVIPYALRDTEFTLRIFEQQYPLLQKHADLMVLYGREQALQLTLLDMESRGMKLDLDRLNSLVKEYAMKILNVELDIADIAGEDFNPNSPKQITEYFLFVEGVQVEGTSREVLETVPYEMASKILELRDLKKIHGTYLAPLLDEQRDGLIHPNFRQHGTKTGRMSSGGASG
jgi:DNA polymerase-1